MKIDRNSIFYFRHSLALLAMFCTTQSSAQILGCYCYENEALNYTEWIYFTKDSAIVYGRMQSTCSTFDLDTIMDHADKIDQIFVLTRTGDEVSFTKSLEVSQMGIDLQLHYHYHMNLHDEGLECMIIYEPLSFRDSTGPPERIYRRCIQ